VEDDSQNRGIPLLTQPPTLTTAHLTRTSATELVGSPLAGPCCYQTEFASTYVSECVVATRPHFTDTMSQDHVYFRERQLRLQYSTRRIVSGKSASIDSVSRLTPSLTHDDAPSEKTNDQDDKLAFDEKGEHGRPMSAADIRAAKRDTKSFSLTRYQRRFLISEFARETYPDAAHIERLAREIPGLSPKQVNVWFQNR
jgi:hypothetical protein